MMEKPSELSSGFIQHLRETRSAGGDASPVD